MGKLQVRRLGYAMGAEITGVDVTRPLSDGDLAEIRKAWFDYVVLCFPRQDLELEQLLAFARNFGEIDDNRRAPQNRHPQHPEVMLLTNKPVEIDGRLAGGYRQGDSWHSDLSFTERPASGSFLNAKQLPDVGGDTMFANMYLAYDSLSPAMRRIADSLEAVFDVTLTPSFGRMKPEEQIERKRKNPPIVHPVVRVHPETGRKSLNVTQRVQRFVGMTPEESAPLLAFFMEHAVRYEFCYRHRWSVHDLVMWDNRCALHLAVVDYDQTQLRGMIRCSLQGLKTGRVYDENRPLEAATA